jgi:hypothetical protein
MPAPDLHDRLARLFAGRPVVLGPGALVSWSRWTTWLTELGCPTLVLASSHGVGTAPGPETRVVEIARPSTAMITDELRLHDRLLHRLPPHAVAAVESFDPERRGIFLSSPFVSTDEPILGRPVTGGRPRAWLDLEDKLLADEIWAAVGVPRAPYRIVGLDAGELAAATHELASPLGTVWTGDARDGFNGGANYVRWVADDRGRVTARAFFAPRCDRIRVMPFLDGVPCSIHGLVLADGTAALRPVEIAILRDLGHRRFVFGGLGTFWDPPPADREEMRDAARRVGEHLRAAYGYRGAFGIDGILTADGFRPTELNTRMSAGAATAAEVDARFFALLQANLVAGVDTGVAVADVESLLPAMDAARTGRVFAVVEGAHVGGDHSCPVAFDGTTFRRADTETGITVVVGEIPLGFIARVEPGVAIAPGRRLAEVNVALLRFVGEEYATGFGPLAAAPDRRL